MGWNFPRREAFFPPPLQLNDSRANAEFRLLLESQLCSVHVWNFGTPQDHVAQYIAECAAHVSNNLIVYHAMPSDSPYAYRGLELSTYAAVPFDIDRLEESAHAKCYRGDADGKPAGPDPGLVTFRDGLFFYA